MDYSTTSSHSSSKSENKRGIGSDNEDEPIRTKTSSEETRTKSIILNEVMATYDKENNIGVLERKQMIDFAYHTFNYLKSKGNDEVSLSVKIDNGFRNLAKRIDALEQAQKAELEKGNDQIKKIEESCNQVKEATVPSKSEMTYARLVAKSIQKSSTPVSSPEKPAVSTPEKPAIKTSNRFTVLEVEEGITLQEKDLATVQRELSVRFKRDKVKIEKMGKTKNGNIFLHYKDVAEQNKAEKILQAQPIAHTKIRQQPVRAAQLALRGVPYHLTEDDLRQQLSDYNEEFNTFSDINTVKLKKFGEDQDRRRTST